VRGLQDAPQTEDSPLPSGGEGGEPQANRVRGPQDAPQTEDSPPPSGGEGGEPQANRVRGRMRFLLARADIARKDLANLLRDQGWDVDEVAAYRISKGEGAQDLPSNAPDYITLTSSSAAKGTLEMLKEKGHEDWMHKAKLICIGPITSATVIDLGYDVEGEAKDYTSEGLLQALVKNAKSSNPPILQSSRGHHA
jgi:hypothetical protein